MVLPREAANVLIVVTEFDLTEPVVTSSTVTQRLHLVVWNGPAFSVADTRARYQRESKRKGIYIEIFRFRLTNEYLILSTGQRYYWCGSRQRNAQTVPGSNERAPSNSCREISLAHALGNRLGCDHSEFSPDCKSGDGYPWNCTRYGVPAMSASVSCWMKMRMIVALMTNMASPLYFDWQNHSR